MDLADIVARLTQLRPAAAPFIIGVTGSVAVGKSRFAEDLRAHFEADGQQVELVCTDGFLHPNARLEAMGRLMNKGAPDTYDHAALRAALTDIRTGPVDFPSHSHVIYDIDPALSRRLSPPQVLIVEGLTLRHPDTGPADLLDALIYLEADEADLEAWYVARFLQLWDAAEHDPASFYVRFRQMDRAGAEALARTVWREVNLKTLHDHVLPLRARADLIVQKAADHAIASIGPP